MSFLFGRARTRTVADLPKQAREHILKLEGPQGPSKVAIISPHLTSIQVQTLKLTLKGRRACPSLEPDEDYPAGNSRYAASPFPTNP